MMAEKIRVLYVDDESTLLELCKVYLERSGDFIVTTVENAPAAIRILELAKFDAIVSDYQMPEMDGIEFLKIVRARGDKTPFIIFTGKGREEVVIEALNAGADFYIQKGGEPKSQFAELVHKIKKGVEGKEAEEALRKKETRLRTYFNMPLQGIAITSPEKGWLEVNDRICSMLGYTRDELLHKNWAELTHPADLAADVEQFNRAIRGQIEQYSMDKRFIRKDGGVIWTNVSVGVVRKTDGNVDYFICFIGDITERKASEQALTKSQNQLADAMDLSHMVNWEFDVVSGIFTFNDRFYSLYGTTAEREGGYQMPAEVYAREFVHPDEVSLVANEVQNAITATDPNYTRQIEHRIIRRDGEIRHIIVRFRITKDAEGKTVKTHGANQDITDRIAAEESIRLSRAFLDRVIDMSPFAMWISDKEGTVVRVNRSLCETINVAPDLIVGRYNALKDVNLEKQGVMPDVKAVFEQHTQARFTIPWKAADAGDTGLLAGRDMYIDVAIFPILDTHGDLTNVVCQWVDITDRKRIEYALRESEERYRVIVEDQTEFICRFTPDGRLTFVNDAYCRYFSLDKDRCLARPHSVILPPEDIQQMKQHLASLTPQNPVATIEHRIIMPSGEVRWQRWNDRAIFDKNSNVVEYQSVGRDITEHKLAEEALRTKERQLSSIFNNVSEVLYFLSVEPENRFRFVSVNQHFLNATGLSENQVAGRYVDEVIPEPSLSLVLKNYKQAIRENITVRWFEVTPYPSGTKYAHVAVTPIFDENDRCTNLIGSVHDITDLKMAEEELRRSEERYRSLTESSPDQIFIINRDDNLQYVNLQAAKLFNLPLDQILGKPRTSLFSPEIATAQGVLLKKVFETGKPLRQEEAIRFGNVTLWIDTSFVPLKDEKGNIHSVLGVSRDITERKRSEVALVESEEKLQLALFGSETGMWELDIPSMTGVIDDRAAQILGYPKQDIGSHKTDWDALSHPEDVPLIQQRLADYLAGRTPSFKSEHRMRHASGKWIWMVGKGKITHRLQDGSPLRITGTLSDITERKRAEEALQVANEKYSKAFLSAPDAITISELDSGRFIEVNDAATRIFGYSRDELIGKSAHELGIIINKEDREHLIDQVRKNGKVSQFEILERRKSGELYYALVNADTLSIENIPHLITTVRDITDRKQIEDALRESSRKLQEAQEMAHLGFWSWDVKTGRVEWSDEVFRIFGLDPKEFTPQIDSIQALSPWPEDQQRDKELIRRAIESRKPGTYEQRFLRPDNSTGYYYSTFQGRYDDGNNLVSIVGTVLDITERKRVEEELQVTKEKYTKAFLAVPDAITISELESGRFIEVNDAASTLFGYTRDELVNKSGIDLGIWVNKEERDALIDQIKKEGRVEQVRVAERRKSGELFNASITADTITVGNTRYLIAATRDITQRKQMEETLRESETRYKNIVEDQTEFISRFLPDGTHVFVNDAYCRYFKKTREEIMGHLFVPDIPKEDQKIVRQHFRSLTPDNPVASVDHRIIMPDGSVHWQRWSDRAIFDKTGHIVEYQSVGRDITETKQVESELKNSEHLRQDIIDHLPDPTFVINAEGTVIAWNKALEALTGVNARDMVGKGNYEYAIPFYGERRPILVDIFIHPDQEWLKKYSSVQDEGETLVAETSIAYLNGKSVILWVKVSKLYAEDGRLIGAIETIRDVTERKRMEDGLRESEERYSSIFDNNYSVSLLIDPDTGKIVEANAAAVRYYGYSHDELTGRGIYDLNRLPQNKVVRDLQQAKHEKTKHFFSTHYLASGKKRNVEIYSGPITIQGKSYFYSIIHDITERKQAEEALALASKKLNLLSSITRHDILNQLTVLRGYIDLSGEMLHDPEKLREFLEKEERAAATIEEQITFTKEYQEMGVSAPSWQNVNAKLKKAQKQFLMRDVRVEVDCINLEVYADPLFEKVFYNLIDNALRYGGDGMKAIRVHCQESNTGLVITCEDNGVGITQEDKKRLFTRGFGKHTGLGLFLSREILGITGITITENGVPGKGARFEITVPKGMYRFAGNV